jgi:hypothetical protein
MPENPLNALPKVTLYRALVAIASLYSFADVIETLAHVADERQLSKTIETLNLAVNAALSEEL